VRKARGGIETLPDRWFQLSVVEGGVTLPVDHLQPAPGRLGDGRRRIDPVVVMCTIRPGPGSLRMAALPSNDTLAPAAIGPLPHNHHLVHR